jgi:NAD(P)-dependent dehydrogenase (short-subunit alcohol dehydrogenase family)
MADGMLDGKVVLVTGAGRGIGAEVAKLAAAEGAKVVVNDLGGSVSGEGADATPAQEVCNEIVAKGGEAVVNGGSVADWSAARGMVQQAVDTFGRIDGIVNVAGILRDVIFHKMSKQDWDLVIAVHL